jgi:uncharacterized Fe-S radical SAM superfamily protein PflX
MRFLANEVSRDTYVNVMGQYRPCGEAHEFWLRKKEFIGSTSAS